MAYWEFLLQKEGDRSWLPLESPDVEILEGRYRIVARSNRVNTPVEVRIIHQLEEANQPKRRTQKRTTKTNQDGLMVVLPFTWLQPGVWELRCASDVMADMMGEGWQHTVQLDVQPQDSTVDDGEWSFDTEVGAIAESDVASFQSAATPKRVEPPVAASLDEPLTEVQVPETVIQGAETTIQTSEPPAQHEHTAPGDLPLPVPVRVQMDQDSYATRTSLPLVLTGKIVPAERALDEAAAGPDSPAAESTEAPSGRLPVPPRYIHALRVRLLNPQTGNALSERTIPLEVAVLPFAFTCHLDNPDAAETHLLIGQLTVLGADDAVLTQQSFTVTTDLEALLQAIADDSLLETDDPAALTSPFGTAAPPDLTLLNLISKGDSDAEPQFQVTHAEPIPPQIYHPEPTEDASRKALDLPDFSVRASVETAVEEAAPPEDMALPESDVQTLNDAQAIAPPLDLSAPLAASGAEATLDPEDDLSVQSSAVAPTAPAIAAPDATAAVPGLGMANARIDTSTPAVSLSPTDLEFQALNLQDRFLARLSALASDADLHQWLQSQYPASASPSRTAAQNGHLTNGTSTTLTPDRILPLENAHAAREFVIEDDEEPDSPPDAPASASAPGTEVAIPEPLKIPAEQAIPAPDITLPNRDLIAGQPLQILVNLPSVRPRLSVKFWLQDPQTRDLLDGPYWLTTFIPNGHDQLEAGLQVMVPFGCVEVQFEAIAIEVSTQRESRKVSVHRTVIPPDLSTLPVDDINF